MNTNKLKKDFHNLIETIDDANLLSNFYDLIKNRLSSKEGQLWSRLTKNEQEELYLEFEESENPENLISHEEIKKRLKNKWL